MGTPSARALGLLALMVLAAHAVLLIGIAPMTAWMSTADTAGRPQLQARLLGATTVAPPPAAHTPAAPRPQRSGARAPSEISAAGVNETNDTPASPPLAAASQLTPAGMPPETDGEASAPAAAPPASVYSAMETPAPPPVAAASDSSAAVPAAAGPPLLADPRYLPPPVRLVYQMTGQDRGLHYQASGEMVWQHNGRAYTLGLSVRAFLVGARHWRSRGTIGPEGLEPARFSDTRRSEQATHFDRPGQRIVFSSNAPAATLLPGAQDQISLYVQLAAALNARAERFPPGTAVLLQTATVRDALPWRITLEQFEALQIAGESVMTAKWVCQPRQRFDARIEFWSSPRHHQMPARIRITQASGSFIDMHLREMHGLPELAPDEGVGTKTTSP